jgi:hypothetical protein
MSLRSKPKSTADSTDTVGPRLNHVLTIGCKQKAESGGEVPVPHSRGSPASSLSTIKKTQMQSQPRTIEPSREDVLSNLANYFGDPPLPDGFTTKDNSGTKQDWDTISNEVKMLTNAYARVNKAYNRSDTMMMLNEAISPVKFSAPLIMSRVSSQSHSELDSEFYATGDSPAIRNQNSNVTLVKMWGFAGMRHAEDMIQYYKYGVDALFEMESFVNALNGGVPVVLHFDGDAAYEAEDEKFSHNLFAPVVAKRIKEKFTENIGGTIPVHLVITKVQKPKVEKGQTIRTIVNKFCDSDYDDFRSCYFRTDWVADAGVRHSYPYFDRRFFDSGALYVSEPELIETLGSEGQNSKMMEELFSDRVNARFCLGIGGNTINYNRETNSSTGGGVASMQQFIRQGDAFKFDGAVRVNVLATK